MGTQTTQTTTVKATNVNGSQKQEEVKDMVTEFLSEDPANSADNNDRNKHDEVKDMINEFLESSDEETDKKDDPLPGLPEELLRNLPPEMADSLKKNYDQSMRDIARKEVQKSEQTVSKVTELKIETEVKKSVQEKEKDSKRPSQLEHETEVISKKGDDVEDEEDVSLPPTPAVSTPWSEVAARPERPSGPTPAESEAHERKNSGPFSSRKLFPDNRDPSSVSPEVIEAANVTVNKVIDEAKERVTQITRDEKSSTVIERFDEVEVSVDRSTMEEDIFIRDQTRSTTDSEEPGKHGTLPTDGVISGGEVFDWRDDKDGAP